MGYEVVLARYDLTVPGQVGEYGIVRLDVRESRVDCLDHLHRSRLSIGEPKDVLGGELPLVRPEQDRHLPHVVGDGGGASGSVVGNR